MNPESIREFLKGKKTYFVAAFGVLYLLGVWAGFWPFDEKVLAGFGLTGLATLAAKINRNSVPLLLLCGALAFGPAGCANVRQTARTESTNPTNGVVTVTIATSSITAIGDAKNTVEKVRASAGKTSSVGASGVQEETNSQLIQALIQAALEVGKRNAVTP